MSEPFRFTWERAVRSAELGKGERGASTLAVALVLGTYANADGSSVRPGVENVATGCGFAARTVERALDRLRREGWIELVTEHRPGRAQTFRLSIPEHPTTRSGVAEKATDEKPDHTVGETRPHGHGHPTTRSETPDHTVALPVQGPVQGPLQRPVQGPPAPEDVWADLDEEAPPAPHSGEREEPEPVRYFSTYEEEPPTAAPNGETLGRFAAKEQRRRERQEQGEPQPYVPSWSR